MPLPNPRRNALWMLSQSTLHTNRTYTHGLLPSSIQKKETSWSWPLWLRNPSNSNWRVLTGRRNECHKYTQYSQNYRQNPNVHHCLHKSSIRNQFNPAGCLSSYDSLFILFPPICTSLSSMFSSHFLCPYRGYKLSSIVNYSKVGIKIIK